MTDPRELELPAIGMVSLRDSESGQRVLVDTSDPLTQKMFRQRINAQLEGRRRALGAVGIDELALRTDRPYVKPLLAYFRARSRRGQMLAAEEASA